MNAAGAKKIQCALVDIWKTVQLVKIEQAWRIDLPFNDHKGNPFRVYIFNVLNHRHVYLSDGGAILKSIRGCGDLRLQAIQTALRTYGLSLMEDLSIMESSTRDITLRVMSFLQAWCAIDGIIRIWSIAQEEVQDGIRTTKASV